MARIKFTEMYRKIYKLATLTLTRWQFGLSVRKIWQIPLTATEIWHLHIFESLKKSDTYIVGLSNVSL